MTKLRPLLASLAVLALTFGTAPVSGASEITPEQVAGDTPPATISVYDAPLTEADPAWRRVVEDDPGIRQYLAHSPSMGREIPLAVIPAGRPDAPTVYLLGGGGGAEQGRDWISLAPRAIEFYQSRDVNVVIPMAGGFTYFMDWYSDPEVGFLRGPQKWETFLTRELPGPIERELQADGHRAVVGFSMSATSALLHAATTPVSMMPRPLSPAAPRPLTRCPTGSPTPPSPGEVPPPGSCWVPGVEPTTSTTMCSLRRKGSGEPGSTSPTDPVWRGSTT